MSPDRPRPDGPTAAELVTQNLRELTVTLRELEPAVREDADDAVHRARTTSRRLRSLLDLGAPLLRDGTARAERALKALGRALGRARDTEVRSDLIASRLGKKKAKSLRKQAKRKHAEAHRSLVAALDEGLLAEAIAALDELSGAPSARGRRPATDIMPALIASRLAQVEELAGRARRARKPERRADWLHEVRKAARSARYAAETAVGHDAVDDDAVQELEKAATEVQDLLGEWRDLRLLAAWIEKKPARLRDAPRKRLRRLRTDAAEREEQWPQAVASLVGPDWELGRGSGSRSSARRAPR